MEDTFGCTSCFKFKKKSLMRDRPHGKTKVCVTCLEKLNKNFLKSQKAPRNKKRTFNKEDIGFFIKAVTKHD